jgi:RNA polymerase sigma-70 factor (ECF subfamily)
MEASWNDRASDDEERLQRAAGGDQEAWAALLVAHRDRLRRIVALRLDRRLQGRIDPSDVIQETYLEATAALADFAARGEMPLFLWLRWLAGMKLNALHRKHLGTKIRDAAREVSINAGAFPQASSAALAEHLVAREEGASSLAMRHERQARLQEALETMEQNDREVLVLRHFEELTNAEAAQALAIGESAASKRYIRALRKLKQILNEMPGGTGEFRR